MSADCVQDILTGFRSRTCPYTNEPFVHRGTVADLHGDFTAEGWFTRPYSVSTVETSLGEIHDSVQINGLSINYVGPGVHIMATPILNKRGVPLMAKVKDIDIIDDTEWATTDGLSSGMYAQHKKTGEQFAVCGDSRSAPILGHVHLMHVIDGSERWLLTQSGVGWSVGQRLRVLQSLKEWFAWKVTLDTRQAGMADIQHDAEMLVPNNRIAARTIGRIAGDLRAGVGATAANLTAIEAQVANFRRGVTWAQPLVV